MKISEDLLPPVPAENMWTPYLGPTLDAGMATLFMEELEEAIKYIDGPNPVDGIWLGAADDVIMRERGVEFVDGSAPGFCALAGSAPDPQTAENIVKELQQLQRHHRCGAAGQHRGPAGVGDPHRALRARDRLSGLLAGLRGPRGDELRRGATR
jgi:hypothetical protein